MRNIIYIFLKLVRKQEQPVIIVKIAAEENKIFAKTPIKEMSKYLKNLSFGPGDGDDDDDCGC